MCAYTSYKKMAGVIALTATGIQDVHLTGETPSVSFFRQAYRKYTPFALKPERLDYIGTFGENNEVSIPIPSKGDLLTHIWIECPNIAATGTNSTGFYSADVQIPTEFTLHIGGQPVVTIDALYAQAVHNTLMQPSQAKATTGVTTQIVKANGEGSSSGAAGHYVIPFWFSEDWTKALPILAMQYAQVSVSVKCRSGFTPSATPKVYGMFAYLDTIERDFFVKKPYEMLITQVARQLASNTDSEFDLSYFSHPTKSVHIVSGKATGSHWSSEFNFSDATMYINGTPLFEGMSSVYHHTVVPELHCTHLPDGVLDLSPVFTWPLSLNFGRSQPSGSLNLSRVDTAKIHLQSPTGGNSQHMLYAVNYNILKAKDGLCGVLYGN